MSSERQGAVPIGRSFPDPMTELDRVNEVAAGQSQAWEEFALARRASVV
jgi:hypothetical protein